MCVRVCVKVNVYMHCSTCVYASWSQTACFYWKAQEGDLSDKMVCIVCSVNMPTFLNLPSCKRCWRLKQATHYSCMRAFGALCACMCVCGFSFLFFHCVCFSSCSMQFIHLTTWCFLLWLLQQEGKDGIYWTTENDWEHSTGGFLTINLKKIIIK